MKNQTRNAAELYSTMLNELFPKENIEKELDYNNVEEPKQEQVNTLNERNGNEHRIKASNS